MKFTLLRAALMALVVGAMAGCGGGGGGGSGTIGGGGGGGGTGGTTGGSTLTPAPTPTGGVKVDMSALTATQLTALNPQIAFGGAVVASPPKVSFSVQDQNGNPIVGLGKARQGVACAGSTGNYTVAPQLANLSFAIAKLVPGSNGSPSKWVNYIVKSAPQKNKTTGADVAPVPQRPSSENTGTLVDNGDGTYVYTFATDITTVGADVAALDPAKAADLGDLTYDQNAVHRLTVQFSGTQWGTGTYTADCSASGVAAVTIPNPYNGIFDFVPATGKAAVSTDPSRDIAATAKCNECHNKLGGGPGKSAAASPASFHGGARNDVRYCVVCHTDQRKYGRTEATIDAATLTFSGSTNVVDGRTVGNLPNYLHKIHMGKGLAKKNYNYANVLFNEVGYPQDVRNCTKCHDGSSTSTAKTANGNNWKQVPSRLACGSCHDGINFATGKGVTLADSFAGKTTSTYGHIGGAQADDSKCALCHGSDAIPLYHVSVTPPDPNDARFTGGTNTHSNSEWIDPNWDNLPAGAIKVTWEISSVSRNASKQPVIVFRGLQNGAVVALNDPASKTEIWDNFFGSPNLYFVWAEPQDGVAAPADFNKSASVYLKKLWNGTATGTLSAADSNGFYTATLTGTIVPDTAVMLTGGVGFVYGSGTPPLTQKNLADYPATVSAVDATTYTGGLAVPAPNVMKVATGYTGRRTIVDNAKCNNCHQKLGVFTEAAFHSGQRNDGTTCAWCHTPNRASSGWSADAEYFVHAIHGKSKRSVNFTWHAASATEGFFDIAYPGILNDCETCHVAGSYDFSATANASSLPNRLYRLTQSGTFTAGISTPAEGYQGLTTGVNYGASGTGTNLVNSPIAGACSSCHDSSLAISHMKSNGGSFYAARSTAIATAEQCTLCHLAGKVADIKVMHQK